MNEVEVQRRLVEIADELRHLLKPGTSMRIRLPKGSVVVPGQLPKADTIHIIRPVVDGDLAVTIEPPKHQPLGAPPPMGL